MIWRYCVFLVALLDFSISREKPPRVPKRRLCGWTSDMRSRADLLARIASYPSASPTAKQLGWLSDLGTPSLLGLSAHSGSRFAIG
ncbi:Hypothetical protein NTJ_11192 [Nesidiocoris tenuis]|uniref:Secreted protein n=1 Tax=Nesidiocoris tenuis TaxID=355587 RepID=A0ABN7B6I5_9HEMI|nr:Hypothetical protein NTJ_11192 [Nesidiocoris tenuis]